MNRNTRGQSDLLWWLVNLSIIAALFASIVYFGTATLSDRSLASTLQNELRFERTITSLSSVDPYTGARTHTPGNITEMIEKLNTQSADYAIMVTADGDYYSDRELYNLLSESIGLKTTLYQYTLKTSTGTAQLFMVART